MKKISQLYAKIILQGIEQLPFDKATAIVNILYKINSIESFKVMLSQIRKPNEHPDTYVFPSYLPFFVQYNSITVYHETNN